MGKVKIGARDFKYAVVKNNLCPDGIQRIPGLTEAKLEIKNEIKSFAADDGPYVQLSSGISSATLDVKLADMTSKARKDFFGIDLINGIEAYRKNLMPNDIAVMFKSHMDDNKGVYVALLKGKFSIPSLDAKTIDSTPDVATDDTTGNFSPRGDDEDALVMLIGREDNPDFFYSEFEKAVFPATDDEAKLVQKVTGNNTAG